MSLNDDGLLTDAVRISVLCNEAALHRTSQDRVEGVGDPTETALLSAAHELGWMWTVSEPPTPKFMNSRSMLSRNG